MSESAPVTDSRQESPFVGGHLARAAVGRPLTEGLALVPVRALAREWLRRRPDVADTVAVGRGDWPAWQAGQSPGSFGRSAGQPV